MSRTCIETNAFLLATRPLVTDRHEDCLGRHKGVLGTGMGVVNEKCPSTMSAPRDSKMLAT
ncbi:uncharacterized protein N7498_006866 [Penicillium cinerascens]|uniref:Uncharacterized protein n=1 Tax=Penicillium cinerascens TaxID=70096 RepID=A0A9W9JK01_9EURO|nr:uncharacterized protein N7498_006866 [Penicillium cinerascens]KAJ5197749.1 hypothetical protein N7498_006866 [Penicillium cinerascens]